MTDKGKRDHGKVADEIFDFSGTDPDQLKSGRIPDPQPEHSLLFRWLADVLGAIEEFLRARGGTPLRMAIRFFWGLLAAIGIFLLVGPIINKQADFDDVIASSKIENVDWIAKDASFDFDVTREDDGSFQTTVHEKYTAVFVNGDENTVLRRLITEVHGHDAEFELLDAKVDGEAVDAAVTGRATTTDIELRPSDESKFSGTHLIEVSYVLNHLIENSTDAVTEAPVDQWNWPVIAPNWPQATSGLEVSVTLPRDVDDALVRKPHATVGWLLVSGNEWLEPDSETPESVTYSFSNDDNLPPNSQVVAVFVFEGGTFTQPEETTLFWVQTWGPLIPLGILLVIMLFSLAARWVVWADTVGEPWFVVRSDPPDNMSPMLAAQLLGKTRHAEIVSTLADGAHDGINSSDQTEDRARKRRLFKRKIKPTDGSRARKFRERWLTRLAQAGRRAGRAGNFPSVAKRAASWSNADAPVDKNLRWVPDSYVRDTFIWAPIAVTLLQWGILRQLSEQFILLVVWWPFAFVAASTIIACISIWAVLRPRPLTRKGALAVQQLKGIDVYARGTRLLDRGPVDDALLPYAVLFESPRRAGKTITEHAVRETGNRDLANGWRGSHFLSIPSMLAFIASIAIFAGSIVLVSMQPVPYGSEKYLSWPSSDVKGTIWTQVEGFNIEAELTRDDNGEARLDVTEHLTVGFEAGGASIPQIEREWTKSRFGQDLGLTVSSVTVDGDEVAFASRDGERTVAMATRLTDVIEGVHDVTVRYSLSHPAVEVADGGDRMQQVRWAAMLRHWDDTYYTNQSNAFDGSAPVRPMRFEFTVAPDLVNEVRSGGWTSYGDADDQPYESGTGFKPWAYENDVYLDGPSGELGDSIRYETRIGVETIRDDGALVASIDADAVESRVAVDEHGEDAGPPNTYGVDPEVNAALTSHELSITGDPGATLNFEPGTFTNVTPGSYDDYRTSYQTPLITLIVFTLFVVAVAIAVFVYVFKSRRSSGYSLLLTSAGTITLLAVAETIVFWWVVGDMRGSSPAIPGLVTLGLFMWVVVVAQWIIVGRNVAKAAKSSSKSSSKSKPKSSSTDT
ncbi:MAG: DUF2207 domain-containing protein [Leucobacter sp.]